MMYTGSERPSPDLDGIGTSVPEAENRAWNSFYHSGSVEDYIRYAQLKRQNHSGAQSFSAGATDAD